MNTQDQVNYSFSDRVLRDMRSAVLVLDVMGDIVYVNGPASKALEIKSGHSEEGSHFKLSMENPYNDSFNEAIFDALYNKDETSVKKVQYMAPSGKKYVFLMSCSFLSGEDTDNSQLVITLNDETVAEELKRKVIDSAKTFTAFIFAFSVWMIIYAFWEFMKRPISADYMTHGIELMGFFMLLYIMNQTSLTWDELGVGTKKPGKTIKTALIVAVGAFFFLVILKFVGRMINPNCFDPDAPFIDFSRFGVRQLLYLITAGVQEFIARSVMQGNLRKIMVSKHRATLAIILSSLIFAALHIHFGFLFMVGAGILAGLEGILYEKQLNIFGVWIVHWVFGVSGTLLHLIGH